MDIDLVITLNIIGIVIISIIVTVLVKIFLNKTEQKPEIIQEYETEDEIVTIYNNDCEFHYVKQEEENNENQS